MQSHTLGLYVHIPFCRQKCSYCDFYSLASDDRALQRDYVAALSTHITEAAAFTGKQAGANGFVVDSIYFGGGTPTCLGAKPLARLLKTIRNRYQTSRSCEITLEANPGTVDAKSLKRLRGAGFNRISFGVQATEPALLETLGRIHTAEQAADALRDAKAAGFDNISVDLLYGVPGQTPEMTEEALETVISWQPQHISFYGLKLEEGTPLYAAAPTLPEDDEQAEVYLRAVELLARHGYLQYEISNFAQKGFHCRHNLKYWLLEPYMGFGAAAHSDFGNKRYAYVRDVRAYIQGVRDEDAIMSELSEIRMLERAGEYLMLGLRTTRGVSGSEYARLFRASFNGVEDKLEQCAKWGLAEPHGERWRLTPKGFLVSNQILAQILDTDI